MEDRNKEVYIMLTKKILFEKMDEYLNRKNDYYDKDEFIIPSGAYISIGKKFFDEGYSVEVKGILHNIQGSYYKVSEELMEIPELDRSKEREYQEWLDEYIEGYLTRDTTPDFVKCRVDYFKDFLQEIYEKDPDFDFYGIRKKRCDEFVYLVFKYYNNSSANPEELDLQLIYGNNYLAESKYEEVFINWLKQVYAKDLVRKISDVKNKSRRMMQFIHKERDYVDILCDDLNAMEVGSELRFY